MEGFKVWTLSCRHILNRLKSVLLLGHSKTLIIILRHLSKMDLTVCFGLLSCCIIHRPFSNKSWPNGRTFISYGWSPSPLNCIAAPAPQYHHSVNLLLTVMFLLWNSYARYNWIHIFKNIVVFPHQSTQYYFRSHRNFCIIFISSVLCLTSLAQHIMYCANMSITEASARHRFFHFCLCPSLTFWMTPWRNFGGLATPGVVHHCNPFQMICICTQRLIKLSVKFGKLVEGTELPTCRTK